MTMQILFIRRNNFPTMWIKIPANRYVHERCMFSTFIALLKWRQHFGAMFWHEGIWVVQPFAVNKLKRKRKEWSTSMNGLHFFWHVFIDAKDKLNCLEKVGWWNTTYSQKSYCKFIINACFVIAIKDRNNITLSYCCPYSLQ